MENENEKLIERNKALSRETLLLAHQVTNLTHQLKRAMEAADRRVVAVAGSVEPTGKVAAWIDQFGNVFPLGAYSPSGKPCWIDADKRGWKPLFREAAPQPVDAAQTVPELVTQLREYAANPGYSHSDYADVMRQAADALATPSLAAQPAAQTVLEMDITGKHPLGYRPTFCDKGRGTQCCDHGCQADIELAEMRPVAQPTDTTAGE